MGERPIRERPILFSGAMVKALLEGRKTQTRRAVKQERKWADRHPICKPEGMADPWSVWWHGPETDRVGVSQECRYGKPGDRLFVRENGWQPSVPTARELRDGADTWPKYAYDADGLSENDIDDFKRWGWKRRPSIHMPREFSRITLEITGVRVERLQDISEADAVAEGCQASDFTEGDAADLAISDSSPEVKALGQIMKGGTFTAKLDYMMLWDSINGRGSVAANPFVWVLEFKQATK